MATIEAIRRRKARRNLMATRLQCLIRKRAAYNERMRLLATWIEQLRNNAAVTIQRITRGYSSKVVAKRMADERQRFLEEQEKARQTNQEQEAATLIQSHVRRRIAKMHCANRLVEIGLHERLLWMATYSTFSKASMTTTFALRGPLQLLLSGRKSLPR